MFTTLLVLCVVGLVGSTKAVPPCVTEAAVGVIRSKSVQSSGAVQVKFENTLAYMLKVNWVDFQGAEVPSGSVEPFSTAVHSSYAGHHFVLRDSKTNAPLFTYEVNQESGDQTATIPGCGDFTSKVEALYTAEQEEEFMSLVSQHTPCEPADDSSQWSCIRHVTKEEYAARPKANYGFQAGEGTGRNGAFTKHGRKEFQVIDNSYISHIPKIPKLTKGVGLLKMTMPKFMRKRLLDFYAEEIGRSKKQHEPISGAYSNVHVVPMDKIDLDDFRGVRSDVVMEMKTVLQWWTMRSLVHTSTFGARIYHNESMLINHVDRADTHLASAVLQLYQNVTKGWPLEVMGDDGEYYEVYLQPGEMVLYEGARLFHGRPMRCEGTDFANVFSHFKPRGYLGPHAKHEEHYVEQGPAEEYHRRHQEL